MICVFIVLLFSTLRDPINLFDHEAGHYSRNTDYNSPSFLLV